MSNVIQNYLASYFEFYFAAPWNFVALMLGIYVLYKSIDNKTAPLPFLKGGSIALTINHYLVIYMHVNELIALVLTVGVLPIVEWLLDLSLEWIGIKHKKEEPPILAYGGHTGAQYIGR